MRSEVDKIATMLWYQDVRLRAGVPTAYAMEKLFAADKFHYVDGRVKRPCKWDKYEHGEHAPSPDLVARLEQDEQFSGSAQWLTLPLWRVLRQPGPTLAEIDRLLRTFSHPIKKHLFEREKPGFHGLAHRRKALCDEGIIEIRRWGTMEAFTCLMALLREAEHKHDDVWHRRIAFWAMGLFFAISVSIPLSEVVQPFFAYLSREFLSVRYPDGFTFGVESINPKFEVALLRAVYLMEEDAGIGDGSFGSMAHQLFCAQLRGVVESFETARTRAAEALGLPIEKLCSLEEVWIVSQSRKRRTVVLDPKRVLIPLINRADGEI